jgi:hypothetical protein
MLIKASRLYGIGLTLGAITAVAACSDDPVINPGGAAGSSSQAGTGGAGTAGTGTAGTGTAGTATAGTSAGGAPGFACAGAKPMSALITQFDDLVANPMNPGNFTFTAGVPGGTFHYQPGVFMATDMGKALNVKGKVNAYDGVGIYLNSCTDASAYTGVSFRIKGKAGPTGKMSFRVQTNATTAISMVNMKGSCVVPAGTVDTYELCHPSMVDVPVTEAGAVVEVTWAQLLGGVPVAAVTGKDIVGLEWAFAWMPGGVVPSGGAGGGGAGGAAGGSGGSGGAAGGSGGAAGGTGGAAGGSGGAAGGTGGAAGGSGGAAGGSGGATGGYDADVTIDDIKFTGGPAGGSGAGGGAGGSGGAGGAAAGSGGAGGGAGGSGGGGRGGNGGAGGN